MRAEWLHGTPGLVVAVVLTALSAPVVLMTGYLALLALAARRQRPADTSITPVRLDIVVPAHNEAVGIAATLESLAASDYPADCFRVVVVADNCTDDTAAIARARGVVVLERTDAAHRGKGYALRHAFEWSRADGWSHAVVVIDADTTVAAGALRELGARLAVGEGAVQADYRVRNAGDSWRTRLLEVAFTLHHTVRSLGRERLQWSCGLRGNGMAFSHETLDRVPFGAFSIVEDIEYGLMLGLAGVRASYAMHAQVRGDMPAGGDADARTQRARWEVGRRLLQQRLSGTLWQAWRHGRQAQRRLCGDLLADLLTPPLTTVVLYAALGGLAAVAAWSAGAPAWLLVPWAMALLSLLLYLVQGIRFSDSPRAALTALLTAPVFIAWKLLGRRGSAEAERGEWIRTVRPAQR